MVVWGGLVVEMQGGEDGPVVVVVVVAAAAIVSCSLYYCTVQRTRDVRTYVRPYDVRTHAVGL